MDPARSGEVEIEKSHPFAVPVGLPPQAQQDRVAVDANHLGVGEAIGHGVAEGTGTASQVQDPQGPALGVGCRQHLQHRLDALVAELYESGLLDVPGGEQFLRGHSFSFGSVSGLKIRWGRFSCARRCTRR